MFGGGKGGGNPLSQQTPTLHSLRVQTSAYGQILPVVIGTCRIPGKLLDYVDFTPIAHTDVTYVGGKGGGGQKQQTTTTYTYTAAVVIALCVGKVKNELVKGIARIWTSKGKFGVNDNSETFVLGASPYHHTPVNAATFHSDRGASVSTTVNIWEADWNEGERLPDNGGQPGGSGSYVPQTTETPLFYVAGGSPGPGQYSFSGADYVFNAAETGKTITVHYANVPNAADGSSGNPVGILNFTFFNGDRPQTSWAYMTSKHPGRDQQYSGTCYVANEAADAGSSGTLENYQFELYGLHIFGAGVMDAGVADLLQTILDLANWDNAKTSSMGAVADFTAAAGLFFSLYMDTQKPANQWMQEICDAANIGAVWSEGKLKLIPFGDHSIAGNGHAYNPDLTPIYDLGDDDFIAEGDEPAVTIEREDPETTANQVKIEFLNRANEYNTDIAPDEDAAAVFRFGAVPESQTRNYHFICDPDVAGKVANHRRLRITQIDPLKIHFKLGWQYELLEQMNLVTLTVKEQGWVKKPVRLVSFEEDEQTGVVSWTAEDFPWGTAHPTLYPKEGAAGSRPDTQKDPGMAEPPIVFEPPDRLHDSAAYDLWIGVTGQGADWGGASVWASPDGSSYKLPYPGCRVAGKARMGTLQATLNAGSDHDVTNTVDVDLAISNGKLLSGTDDDRDSFRTLCYIEGTGGQYELISYKTATLVSGNRYQLTDLRRGVYGTPILSHASGKKFLRLDDAVLKLSFESVDVGKTAHLKFTSFNTFGSREQSLADVTDYTYSLSGKYNNFSQIVSNSAKVGSVGTGGPPFTAATVQVYLRTGAPGTAFAVNKADGTSRAIAADNFIGKALSTTYYAMLNPTDDSIYLLTYYPDVSTAVFNGHVALGATTTPDSGGAGGTDGGGGGSDGGGGGIPPIY